MRLISRHDFALHEFHGDAIPQYVILSHTWTTEEVSFEDFQRPEIKSLLNAALSLSEGECRSPSPSTIWSIRAYIFTWGLALPHWAAALEFGKLFQAIWERRPRTQVYTTVEWINDVIYVINCLDTLGFDPDIKDLASVHREKIVAHVESYLADPQKFLSIGHRKIIEMARLCSRQDSIQWFWIDTCCIDKTNSAELAEAINSMSIYYARAKTCMVYLADVTASTTVFTSIGVPNTFEYWEFETSHWFTRGWTLQELLFPDELMFYDCEWSELGYRASPHVARAVGRATGIPPAFLIRTKGESLRRILVNHGVPVAQMMSWAAQRRTTREEDKAYCLLGLFGVNMPLIYGEGGAKAFRRLQEHIIRSGNGDSSLFIWKDPLGTDGVYSGLLASNPSHFQRDPKDVLEVPHITSFAEDDFAEIGNGSILLNVEMLQVTGITAEMRLESASLSQTEDTLVTLDHRCDVFVPIIPSLQNPQGTYTSILLRKAQQNSNIYTRIYPAWIVTFGQAAMRSSLAKGVNSVKARIRDKPIFPRNDDNISLYGLHVKTGALESYNTKNRPVLRPSEGHLVPVRHYGDVCQATYGLIDLPCTNGRHRLTLTYHGNTLPSDTSSWKTTLNAPGKLVVRTELLPKDLDELPNTHGKIHLPPEYGSVADIAGSSSAASKEVKPCPDCRIYVIDYDVSLWENQAVLTVHSLNYEYNR